VGPVVREIDLDHGRGEVGLVLLPDRSRKEQHPRNHDDREQNDQRDRGPTFHDGFERGRTRRCFHQTGASSPGLTRLSPGSEAR
jgi:hypothetical protein